MVPPFVECFTGGLSLIISVGGKPWAIHGREGFPSRLLNHTCCIVFLCDVDPIQFITVCGALHVEERVFLLVHCGDAMSAEKASHYPNIHLPVQDIVF